jgi:hypothetical protein
MNEIQNYSFICQIDKFISIKNRNDESKYTPFFILMSGLWEIFSRQVEFRDL